MGKSCHEFVIEHLGCDICLINENVEEVLLSGGTDFIPKSSSFDVFFPLLIWTYLSVNIEKQSAITSFCIPKTQLINEQIQDIVNLPGLNKSVEHVIKIFTKIGYKCNDINLNDIPSFYIEDTTALFKYLDDISLMFDSCFTNDPNVIINVRHSHHHNDEKSGVYSSENSMAYGILASLVAWLIITLLGLLGFILIPLKRYNRVYTSTVQGLVGLGFGTLVGDAVYHLIPHSLESGHGSHVHDHGGDETLYKLTLLIVGLVLFYLIEVFFKTCRFFSVASCGCHHSEPPRQPSQNEQIILQGDNVKIIEPHDHHHNQKCVNVDKHIIGGGMKANSHECCHHEEKDHIESNNQKGSEVHLSEVHNPAPSSINSATSVIIILVLSDMFHHVFDGLAIGAAFNNKWPNGFHDGVSTSLAIAFHELPHKVSDIGFLIQKGYSVVKATSIIFCSSLISLVGVIIGIVSSQKFEDASTWINLFTAGMFLYIAMVFMMSQMIEAISKRVEHLAFIFIPHLIGMMTGFTIMFLVAKYEDKLIV